MLHKLFAPGFLLNKKKINIYVEMKYVFYWKVTKVMEHNYVKR